MDHDHFGWSVAISGDVIVVGARLDDNSNGTNAGSVYIYQEPPGGWQDMTETLRIQAPDGAQHDEFGTAVAIEGTTLVAGSPRDAPPLVGGSAYVFEYELGAWSYRAKLTASAALARHVGISVALSGDRVALGADLDQTIEFRAGAVYLYDRPPAGWTDMTETAQLTASDAEADDGFGHSVALFDDALVVGAPDLACCGAQPFGAAYAFLHDGSQWQEALHFVQVEPGVGDF